MKYTQGIRRHRYKQTKDLNKKKNKLSKLEAFDGKNERESETREREKRE